MNAYSEKLKKFRSNYYRFKGDGRWDEICQDVRRKGSDGDGAIFVKSINELSGEEGFLDRLMDPFTDLKLRKGKHLDASISGSDFASTASLIVPRLERGSDRAMALWEECLLEWAGRQLWLGWHAGYSQYVILCDSSAFVEETDNLSFSGKMAWERFSEGSRQKYLSLDLEPKFIPKKSIFDSKGGSFEYYVFSPFGGVIRQTWPRLKEDDAVTVIHYHCRVHY